MNKEEAKKQIDADEASINGVKLITAFRAKDIIDAIDDHPKVKLPREVGEELDAWKLMWGTDVGEYLTSVCTSDEYTTKAQEWREAGVTVTRSTQLAEAFNHGWEAEPEAKWYVQTPKEWWEEPNIPEWMHFDTCRGVCSGFSKLGRTSFTCAELKKYHLDSDIFTLVPVENEEVSR